MVYIVRALTHYPKNTYSQELLSKLLHRHCRVVGTNQQLLLLTNKIQSIFRNSSIHKRHFLLSHHDLTHVYQAHEVRYAQQRVRGDEGEGMLPTGSVNDNTEVTITQTLQQTLAGTESSQGLTELASEAILELLQSSELRAGDINCLVSTTGLHTVPTLDLQLLDRWSKHYDGTKNFSTSLNRIALNGAASGGGAKTLSTAYTYLKANPTHTAIVLCAESGSHGWLGAIQHSLRKWLTTDTTRESFYKEAKRNVLNDIIVSCILGDGVGVALMCGDQHPLAQRQHGRTQIVDAFTSRLPNSQNVIQRIATPAGYRTVLHANLPKIVCPPLVPVLQHYLQSQHSLNAAVDVDWWCIHPGGANVLNGLERLMKWKDADSKDINQKHHLRHSWHSMAENGNCSSVSVIDVLRRCMSDTSVSGRGILAAVGPGITYDGLLLQR